MSEKRRDNKNRILRTGESQRADGKYMYRYVDANGKTQCLYSWRLVKTDTVPEGKKDNGQGDNSSQIKPQGTETAHYDTSYNDMDDLPF